MELKKHPQKDLRKKYPLHFAIGVTLSLALTLTAFQWSTLVSEDLVDLGLISPEDHHYTIDILPPIPDKEIKPPKPQIPKAVRPPNFTTEPETIEIDRDIIIEPEIVPEPELSYVAPPEDTVQVYTPVMVSQQAEPHGGWDGFKRYLMKNLNYPSTARRQQVEGKVYVSFVVSPQGEITQIKVIKGIGFGCDQEAIRVVERLPDWSPARRGGRPVAVRMVLPIVFKLN